MKSAAQILPDHPAYDVTKHLAYVKKLHAQYPFNNDTAAIKKVKELTKDTPPLLFSAVQAFLADLIEDNLCIYEAPTIHSPRFLMQMQKRLTLNPERAFSAIRSFLYEIYRHVPKERGAFTVPLSEHLNVEPLIAHCWKLYEVKDAGEPLFPTLRKQLFDNMVMASGYYPETYDGKKQLTPPIDSKLPPQEKLQKYLDNTPFLELFKTPVPFSIPRKTFASHGIILAPPNHGKTQLGTLIAKFLGDPDPVGCVVLDPHGELFATLQSRVPPHHLVCLDPDTAPPALNFLDFGTSTQAETLQTFSYLMSSLSGGLTDKQGAIVPYLLKLLRQIPDASLETLRLVVDEKVKRPDQSQFAGAIAALQNVDQGFFHNQFYSTQMQVTKDAIGWKLYSALSSETFREMFSAKTNSFNAADAMRERKVVLVKGSETSLGEQGLPIFLQYVVSQYLLAAIKRHSIPAEKRHLYILFADEASHIFNHQTTRVLTECRKWGLGFMGATQLWSQIPDEVKSAVLGATAIKIVGKLQHNDASVLSRDMECDVPFIRSLQSVERSHAEWGCHVANLTPRALRITVPFRRLEAMPQYAQSPPREAKRDDGKSPPLSNKPSVPPATTNNSQHTEERRDTPQPKPTQPDTPDQSPMVFDTDH